ncbi:tail fiber assembly protein [Citrobacter freundii]|nr:tail fiber assembly protein [Citrobacter freundii]HCA1231001.1 tail fiber assembly protein [Citrobacter freundii]HCA1441458.1 tail fiber assembly protein [Citrobacter freundii]HCA1864815.1 tail fiber assembly protein [Citrobacter freundii]HCA2846034.1 tail fiber assembly protein [Citrobacter freundii]
MACSPGGVGHLISGALEAVDTSTAPDITWPTPPVA